MSFSFSFPHKPLLHKRIEDQWFDRSPKETQSTLTALEAAEEAYAQRLAKITTPDVPPVVLGMLQHQNSVRQQQLRAQQQQQQQQQQLLQAEQGLHSNVGTNGERLDRERDRESHTPSRNRRSRTSTDTQSSHAHSHSHSHAADDQSTVVNPNARNRRQASQHPHQHRQEPAMFWNRTRSRRSAGGDR